MRTESMERKRKQLGTLQKTYDQIKAQIEFNVPLEISNHRGKNKPLNFYSSDNDLKISFSKQVKKGGHGNFSYTQYG